MRGSVKGYRYTIIISPSHKASYSLNKMYLSELTDMLNGLCFSSHQLFDDLDKNSFTTSLKLKQDKYYYDVQSFIVSDFSRSQWRADNNIPPGNLASYDASRLMEEAHVSYYLLASPCDRSSATFSPSTNGWVSGNFNEQYII